MKSSGRVLTNAEAVALASPSSPSTGLSRPPGRLPPAPSASPATPCFTAIQHVNRNGYRPLQPAPRPRCSATHPTTRAPTLRAAARAPAGPGRRPSAAPKKPSSASPTPSPDGTRTRRCGRCGETKPIDHYRYVNKGRKKTGGACTFAWQSWCTTCWATYQQERYPPPPEKPPSPASASAQRQQAPLRPLRPAHPTRPRHQHPAPLPRRLPRGNPWPNGEPSGHTRPRSDHHPM